MDTVVKYRWALVGVLIVCAAVLTPGIPTAMETDNAISVWFVDTDPRLQTYEEYQQEFGNDEAIALHLERDSGIFTPEVLTTIEQLSGKLEEIEGVARVHSVLSVRDAVETEEGIDLQTLFPESIPEDTEQLERAAERVFDNPLFADRLIGDDGRQTMLWVEMEAMDNFDAERDRVVSEVRGVADEELGDDAYAMGGLGVVYSALNVLTEEDSQLFIAVVYLLMILLIWWIFRSWRILVGALGVITVATIASLGIYGLMGNQMNMVTVVLPVLVVVLGIADAVHLPTTFNHLRDGEPDGDNKQLAARALGHVAVPCFLTTLTTVGCFLALVSSPMEVIQQLGIYSAVGIGAALLSTYLMMTAALCALPEDYSPPEHRILDSLLGGVRDLVVNRRAGVMALLIVIVAVSLWGATKVQVDTYSMVYLPDDHRVVQDHEAIENNWGAYVLVEYLIRPDDGYAADDPEVLAATEEFVDRVEQHDRVRNGFSLASVYRRMAVFFAGDMADSTESITELSPEQVEQLGFLLSMQQFEWNRSSPEYRDNLLALVTNEQRDLARVSLTADMMSAREMDELFGYVDEVGAEATGEVASIEPAGYPALYVELIDHVMTSMVRGFFIALALIFIILLVGLRSWRLALIGLPANVFPVVVMMGVMGFIGVDLDIGTSMVGAIVIGIAIDDSVHFLHHWKEAEQQGLSWKDSVDYAFRHAGKAALVTTVILVGGFPVLMLASLGTAFYMGLLTTVAAAAALIADLLLLPMLLRPFSNREADGEVAEGEGRP